MSEEVKYKGVPIIWSEHMSEEAMYRGKPVKFWADYADYRNEVATERGKIIKDAWHAMNELGFPDDGRTSLSDAIRKAIIREG